MHPVSKVHVTCSLGKREKPIDEESWLGRERKKGKVVEELPLVIRRSKGLRQLVGLITEALGQITMALGELSTKVCVIQGDL